MPKHREPNTDCHSVELLIEGYVDGELGAAERATLEAHLEHCGSCAGELALARRICGELHDLPRASCPPAVTRKVLDHAAARPALGERLRDWWGTPTIWRPALALALVAALSVGYWRLSAPAPSADVPPSGPGSLYSTDEIAQAEADLKLALAYLGEISQKASDSFGAELGNRLVIPVSRSLGAAILPQPQPEDPGETSDVS